MNSGREDRARPIDGELVQPAMDLYERRFARDKKQIRDALRALEHARQK